MEYLLQFLDIKKLGVKLKETLRKLKTMNEEQDLKMIIRNIETVVLPEIRTYRAYTKQQVTHCSPEWDVLEENKEFYKSLLDFLVLFILHVDSSFPIEMSRGMLGSICETIITVAELHGEGNLTLAMDTLMKLCLDSLKNGPINIAECSALLLDKHKQHLSVDAVCEIVCYMCSEANNSREVTMYIKNNLSNNYFQLVKKLLLDCLSILSERSIVTILLDVFPKCNAIDKLGIPYHDIWNKIMQTFKINGLGLIEEEHSSGFVMLSCISDYIFSKEVAITSQGFPIWVDCSFWKILQYGLTHNNPSHRKRSIFFLERAMQYLENYNTEIPHSLCAGLFTWRNQEQSKIKNAFDNICLIMETTEEKQVHVIKPLLPVVSNLLSYTNDNNDDRWSLHTSWILVIFNKLLKHDSKVIKRWTVEQICNLNYDLIPLFKQGQERFLLTNFLEALNDISIYARGSNELEVAPSCTPISDLLPRHFQSCYEALKTTNKQAVHFQELLKCIRNLSWSAVPLVYVSYALLNIPQSPLWNMKSIIDLREIFINILRTHDVILRSAIQEFMLESFINLVSLTDLTFTDLSSILVIFKREECFQRRNRLHRHISSWLEQNVFGDENLPSNLNINSAESFITNSCSSLIEDGDDSSTESGVTSESLEVTRIARMLVLLFDCKVLKVSSSRQQNDPRLALQPYVEILKTCHSRPYIPAGKPEKCLRFLLTLLIESNLMTNNSNDDLQRCLLDCLHEFLPTFLPYLTTKFFNNEKNVYSYLDLYFKFIEHVTTYTSLHPALHNFIRDCCQKSRIILCDINQTDHFVKRYVAVKCFNMALQFLRYSSTNSKHIFQTYFLDDLMKIFLEGNFLSHIPLDAVDITFADRTHKENPKKLHSNYLTTLWNCVAFYLNYKPLHVEENILIMNQVIQVQDVGSYESLKPVFHSLEHILPEYCTRDSETTNQILETCWKTMFEMKPCVTFWTNFGAYINMAFHPSLLKCDKVAELLMNLASQLYERSESCNGLFIPLVRRVTTIWMNPEHHSSIIKCIPLLVQSLTYGHVHRKDQRITQDAVTFVSSLDVHVLSTELWQRYSCSDSEARVRSVILLLNLQGNNYINEILPLIITHLIEYENIITNSRQRHFANSLIHRVKQRVWQILLLLTSAYTQLEAERVLKTAFDHLIEESLQPSVRQLIEWLAVKLLHNHSTLLDVFWTALRKAAKTRVGSLSSFLSIIYHLANVISNPLHLSGFIQKAIPAILPWCTAQHFNTRIYAQVSIRRLWDSCKNNRFNHILDMYSPLEDLFMTDTEHNGTSRGVKKLLEDYNFLVFHHLDHFSIETIFYELPRLSNMTEDEWIHPKMFEKYNYCLNTNFIPLYNSDNKLSSSQPGTWTTRLPVTAPELEDHKNFQRKLTPWKNLIPGYENLMLDFSAKETEQRSELIVIASLIDRAPNLGGLCRTCEVFGVTEYVVGSLQYTEDKQFQSLSVSADKWVPIKEVKPHELNEYLRAMKRVGYTLIGAEQTANSIKLDIFNFPKKSMLLLGNEKEGIPVELIHLLDVCVEIPQTGFIRSLNVHVTGAILIWEYSRQHQKQTA